MSPLTFFSWLHGHHRDVDRKDDGKRARRRFSDWAELIAILISIGLWTGAWFAFQHQVNQLHGVVHRLQDDEHTGRTNLIAGCLKISTRTAADVNLNWIYYQSERLLSSPSAAGRERFYSLVNELSASDRKVILALASSGTSTRILEVRAKADFNAAFTKARTIDSSLAYLVHTRTALGPSPQPRRWVKTAHFSCVRAYS